jgi:hypothetical protein
MFILDNMKELSRIFETGKYDKVKFSNLTGYTKNIKEKHDQFKGQIVDSVNKVCRFAEYQRLSQLIKF